MLHPRPDQQTGRSHKTRRTVLSDNCNVPNCCFIRQATAKCQAPYFPIKIFSLKKKAMLTDASENNFVHFLGTVYRDSINWLKAFWRTILNPWYSKYWYGMTAHTEARRGTHCRALDDIYDNNTLKCYNKRMIPTFSGGQQPISFNYSCVKRTVDQLAKCDTSKC